LKIIEEVICFYLNRVCAGLRIEKIAKGGLKKAFLIKTLKK
jgi:hypothetical protein